MISSLGVSKSLSLIFYLTLLLVVYSCTSQLEDPALPEALIRINTKKAKGNHISNIINWTKVLPLETTTSSLIRGVNKLAFSNNNIFVLNRPGREDERLMVFDFKTGSYLRDIGKAGIGPTDFKGLRDFYIDPETEEVVCLVAARMAIMFYDQFGQHLRSKRTGLFGSEFEKIEEGFLVYNEHNSTDMSGFNYLIRMNQEGIISDKMQSYPSGREGLGQGETGFITKGHNGEILYGAPFSDTIFQVVDEGLLPRFIFDLNGPSPPISIINDKDALLRGELMGYAHLHHVVASTKETFMFEYIHDKRRKKGIYNRLSGVLHLDEAEDDFINFLFKSCNYFTQYNQTEIVMVISPTIFNSFRKDYPTEYSRAKAQFADTFEQLEELPDESNPVLLFFEVNWE